MCLPDRVERLLQELEQPGADKARQVALVASKASTEELASSILPLVVGFANAQGGTIVVGVEPLGQGRNLVTGSPDIDLDALRRRVHALTQPSILVSASRVQYRGEAIVVIEVPPGIPPHAIRTDKGDEPEQIAQEVDSDPTARELELDESAIDPLELQRLRNLLQAQRLYQGLSSLPASDLLRALGALNPESGQMTVAGLLLAGKEQCLRQYLPGHEVVFLHLTGESEYDQRADYHCSLPAVLEAMARHIEPYNHLLTLRLGLFRLEIPDYPPEVFREALLNALMHRDYLRLDPVYLRLYSNRMELSNPGRFLGGITPSNILSHEPVTRNRLLAEMLQRLGLVERSGMGVKRMYTVMLASGKEPPLFVSSENDVRVVLWPGQTDQGFARFVARRQQQGQEFSLSELVVLSYLKRKQEIDLAETSRIVQRSPHEAHELLGAMTERGLLEPFGQTKGRVYRLSRAVYAGLRPSLKYDLQRDAEESYAQSAITNYVQATGAVTNQTVRTLLRVSRAQAGYILRRLVAQGKLVPQGQGRTTRYVLPQAQGQLGDQARKP